ncbi:hypothetical protein MKZ38_008330 [Zalerion maritima]|uniref:CFEM domain-containing protein n=1 Tax=Zalerion maritima TaxID=339359 RepID=A0AAD5RHR6_9PEZI|nr:hypothetical protein MKZ38_008330 [Zalerion maritima]
MNPEDQAVYPLVWFHVGVVIHSVRELEITGTSTIRNVNQDRAHEYSILSVRTNVRLALLFLVAGGPSFAQIYLYTLPSCAQDCVSDAFADLDCIDPACLCDSGVLDDVFDNVGSCFDGDCSKGDTLAALDNLCVDYFGSAGSTVTAPGEDLTTTILTATEIETETETDTTARGSEDQTTTSDSSVAKTAVAESDEHPERSANDKLVIGLSGDLAKDKDVSEFSAEMGSGIDSEGKQLPELPLTADQNRTVIRREVKDHTGLMHWSELDASSNERQRLELPG